MDIVSIGLIAGSGLATMGMAAFAGLKGWNAWIDLKRMEVTHAVADHGLPPAGNRIELADLKERVRKLEAIAAGIDL
jgi:hypothetical protein